MTVSTKQFNFITFKAVMSITDLEESAYSFILRTIFSYLKRTYSINLDASETILVSAGCTTTSITIPLNTRVLVDQIIRIGLEEAVVTAVVSDTVATTITISPALTLAPVQSTSMLVLLTVIPFELQYAIFQHAKFIYESQKKLTSVISSVTDTAGNKVTYNVKPPISITTAYEEYSPNPIAF